MDSTVNVESSRMPIPLAAGYSFLWAALCDFVLELSLRLTGFTRWGVGVFVGILFCWLLILLLWALFGRLRYAMAVSLVAALCIAGINSGKVAYLGEPLLPSDAVYLANADFLFAMVSPVRLLLGVAALVGCGVAVIAVGRLLARRYKEVSRGSPEWRASIAIRGVVIIVCGAALWHASNFNQGANVWRGGLLAIGHEWGPWHQMDNFRHSGFVVGTLYNLPTKAMEPPAGYSRQTMDEVATRYGSAKIAETEAMDSNLVVVLSESFGDPLRLPGVNLETDPMQHTRSAIQDNWGGEMLSYKVGGGTAILEFEALTGQSLALFTPQTDMPYVQFVSGMESYPSAVGWAKSQGMYSVAIHPFNAKLYRRPAVYETLGFDEFISEGALSREEYIDEGPFISDASAYHEVIRQIELRSAPALIHVVTMQNHGPAAGSYSDPLHVSASSAVDEFELAHWARGVLHTDEALEPFLKGIEALGEKTTVIFFGDHLPGRLGDGVTVERLGDTVLKTPFFIWNTDDPAGKDLGITSATAFLPLALEQIDADITPFMRLLLRVDREVGIVRRGEVLSPEGERLDYAALSASQRQLVDDYRLVQYDFSFGARYALDAMWYSSEE